MAQDIEILVKALSMPSDIWEEVDEQADVWRTNRSAAWLRIYQEWKQYRSTPRNNSNSSKSYKIVAPEVPQC